jgi:CBS domain-containing protein
MKTRDIMTPRPVTVGPKDRPAEIKRLMEAARVHHLPLVDEGRLVGLWLSTEEGPLVMVGPERVHETTPEADAEDTMAALLGGREAAVVWGEGQEPVGVLTRNDALETLRQAFAQGLGRRYLRPVVLRLIGPAGAGKTTLMVRTVEGMGRCQVGVVQANAPATEESGERTIVGASVVDAPNAHWRKGFQEVLKGMGGAQLVVFEDRDSAPVLADRGLGEDLRVLVVPPGDVAGIPDESLSESQALVVTRLDEAPPDFQIARVSEDLRTRHPHLGVFGLAAGHDDRGLTEWLQWLEGQVLSRQH